MKRLAFAVLIVAAITPLQAQSFGETFPVADTRYRPAYGAPRLAANGRDFFLFWTADRKTRVTRIREGQPRTGHVIFDTNRPVHVAWTGKRFLAVTAQRAEDPQHWIYGKVVGRVLDAEAHVLGPEITFAEHGSDPRVAAGTDSVAVLFRQQSGGHRLAVLELDARTPIANRAFTPYGDHAIARHGRGFIVATMTWQEMVITILDERGDTVSTKSMPRPIYASEMRMASDGTRSLLLICRGNGVATIRIDENGVVGQPIVIDDAGWSAYNSDVVWNGAGWTVSYEAREGSHYTSPQRAYVLQLDWLGHTVRSREQSDAEMGNPSLAVLDGRIMAAWGPILKGDGTSVFELPAAANAQRMATYAATEQQLIATTSSANATLFVWKETTGNVTTSIRSGVRMHDGRWNEREVVARDAELVVAASNGREFAILLTRGNESEVVRMNETGHALGPNLKLPRRASSIAGNGTHFALLEDTGNPRFARLLSLAGALSPSVEIGRNLPNQKILSDGNGFLIVGQEWQCSWSCQGIGARAWRLGPDLQRIDTQEVELSSEPATLAGAEWNGSEYIVAWTARGRTVFARVPASPAQSFETRSTDAVANAEDFTTLHDGSLAFVVRAEGAAPRIVVVDTEGQLVRTFATDRADLTGVARVEPLADGALAFLSSSVQNDAPQHGTSHLMMAIARPTPLPPPDAPSVRARLENGRIEVDWDAPAGTINGYRIEYRVDDGTWNELENWFTAGALGTWIKQPAFGSHFAIRMRAFNDGGVSRYSEIALANGKRRRAVH